MGTADAATRIRKRFGNGDEQSRKSGSGGEESTVLSHVISKGFAKNFNDFVNEYRIDEVKAKLKNVDAPTLMAIAFDSGFNSKATFNRAFKKFTCVAPKEFQGNL